MKDRAKQVQSIRAALNMLDEVFQTVVVGMDEEGEDVTKLCFKHECLEAQLASERAFFEKRMEEDQKEIARLRSALSQQEESSR